MGKEAFQNCFLPSPRPLTQIPSLGIKYTKIQFTASILKSARIFSRKNWCGYQKFFLKCYTSRDTQYNCRKTCHFCGPKCKDADIKKCKRMHKSCSNLMISALCKKTCHSCYDDEYNNEYKNKENNDTNNEHKNEEK
ncbi:unnamed protein product [Lepeophtheirus salmonis]|uniref:(salmon louse) hypothetical protein n=1 Tax=Lepeophtheirus salmonis TaxID=72036 RepID=A0A7R8CN00_LEPSM|nr:unnamed protein product [Lepeophtheirus salmonis]CAF2870328.1 unnamed protein product [Lepeophtheirus salmonis]